MSMSQTPASQTPKRPETKQQITVLGSSFQFTLQTAIKGKSKSKALGIPVMKTSGLACC
jgi:hypothetical protein